MAVAKINRGQLELAQLRLELAIKRNDVSGALAALSEGVKVDARLGGLQKKPLAFALEKGAVDVARELLALGARMPANPFEDLIPGWRKLSDWEAQAAASMLRLLVSNGANINAAGASGTTLLERAVRCGNAYLVRELLALGSDPRKGKPLAQCDSAEIFECLLAAGADPGDAIHVAVSRTWQGWSGRLDRLLAAGVDINHRGEEGNTPLQQFLVRSARDNPARITRLKALLRKGADPELANDKGDAAIHLVADTKGLSELGVLLERGVHVDRKDKAGNTALHRVPDRNWQKEDGTKLAMCRALLDAGANPNLHNRKRATPLDLAIRCDLVDVVRFLVSRGAHTGSPVPVPHWQGFPDQKSIAMLRLLVKLGLAHPNDRDADGRTRLHHVKLKSHIKALLALGADVNARDTRGGNALHKVFGWRAYGNARELSLISGSATVLLGAGIDPSAEQAQRLMGIAIQRRDVDLAATLLQRTEVTLEIEPRAVVSVTSFLQQLHAAHPESLGRLIGADVVATQVLASLAEAAGPVADPGQLPPELFALPAGVDAITDRLLAVARAYPRPRVLSTGDAIPDEAMAALIAQLQASSAGAPAAGLGPFREQLVPASLKQLAWSLVRDWDAKGGKDRGWMLDALLLLGDDADVRELGKWVAAWGTGSQFGRARHAIAALAADGRDEALRQLQTLERRYPNNAIAGLSAEQIADAARKRGLDTAQLEDRLVPDLGFDAAGEISLDYGSRRWTLRLTAELRPMLTGEDGKHVSKLPAPSPADDPEKVKAAASAWKALGKELRSNAGPQLRRLERAMIEQRRWTPSEFTAFLLGHPFLGTAVRGLVWAIYLPRKGKVNVLKRSFRVLPDGRLLGVDGKELTLDQEMRVGIAHPLELGKELAAWTSIFSAEAQLQPFAQLIRKVYLKTDPEAENFFGIVGMRVNHGAMRGLMARGWFGTGDRFAGVTWELSNGKTTVAFNQGISASGGDGGSGDVITDVWGQSPDPIAYSELVRELLALRA
jgi:ankyrin repeat protein